MRGTWLIALALIAVPLTGCVADDSGAAGDYSAGWTEEPKDATAGETITMTWEVDGPDGEAAETRVYYGMESSSQPRTAADYDESAGRVAPAEVPGEYDASVTINQPGTYYFAARLLLEENGEAVWTDEVEVEVSAAENGTPQAPVLVEIADSPDSAQTGENITVDWGLSGTPGQIDQTSFYWGTSSVQDPSASDYDHQEGLTKPAEVPGDYNATFTVEEPGTYYGRARAFNDGQAYWSDEIEFEVHSEGMDGNGTGNETGNQTGGNDTAGNVVEIHDEGAAGLATSTEFQPQNITVAPGESITWTNEGNSTHSVDFANETLQDSPSIAPGESWTWTVPEDLAPGDYEYEDGEATTDPATGSVEVQAGE